MCQFKSAILLKDRVYVPDHNHHSRMLKELGIRDDFDTASEVFVRVELSPADGNKASDVDGWRLNVDQDILPDWYMEAIDAPRIKAAVKEWCDKHVLTSGHHDVGEGIWYALGSATVKAWGSATVKAGGSATVEAGGSATVKAWGSATVKAWDSATVIKPKNRYGSPKVTVSDDAVYVNHSKHTIITKGGYTLEDAP